MHAPIVVGEVLLEANLPIEASNGLSQENERVSSVMAVANRVANSQSR